MSKIEKIINGETFTFYQQDFLVNKIRDPEDLFIKVRSFLCKSYEYRETYFANPVWTFRDSINVKESLNGEFITRPNPKNIRFFHIVVKADAGYVISCKSDSDVVVMYKSFRMLKIVDSIKQSSKEIKFKLNGDGESVTECIGYVLNDENQDYEKSLIEGYFEFEEGEVDTSADKNLERITDELFVKLFNGSVNYNYSKEQSKTAGEDYIEIVFDSEEHLVECRKWFRDSWENESRDMIIDGNVMRIYSDAKFLSLFEALIANDDDYGCPKCSIKK